MRRTFYFFCYLVIVMHTSSKGDTEDIQREGRHSGKETARKYTKDALALAEIIKKDPVLAAKQPILLELSPMGMLDPHLCQGYLTLESHEGRSLALLPRVSQ
jgi:hypothetical protein